MLQAYFHVNHMSTRTAVSKLFVRFKNSIPAPYSAYSRSSGTHIPVQALAFALTDRSCAESSSRSSTPVVDWSLSQFRLRTLQGRSQRFFAYSMWKGKRGDYMQPCVSSTRSECYRSNIRGSDLSGELLTVLDDIVGGITKRLKSYRNGSNQAFRQVIHFVGVRSFGETQARMRFLTSEFRSGNRPTHGCEVARSFRVGLDLFANPAGRRHPPNAALRKLYRARRNGATGRE